MRPPELRTDLIRYHSRLLERRTNQVVYRLITNDHSPSRIRNDANMRPLDRTSGTENESPQVSSGTTEPGLSGPGPSPRPTSDRSSATGNSNGTRAPPPSLEISPRSLQSEPNNPVSNDGTYRERLMNIIINNRDREALRRTRPGSRELSNRRSDIRNIVDSLQNYAVGRTTGPQPSAEGRVQDSDSGSSARNLPVMDYYVDEETTPSVNIGGGQVLSNLRLHQISVQGPLSSSDSSISIPSVPSESTLDDFLSVIFSQHNPRTYEYWIYNEKLLALLFSRDVFHSRRFSEDLMSSTLISYLSNPSSSPQLVCTCPCSKFINGEKWSVRRCSCLLQLLQRLLSQKVNSNAPTPPFR